MPNPAILFKVPIDPAAVAGIPGQHTFSRKRFDMSTRYGFVATKGYTEIIQRGQEVTGLLVFNVTVEPALAIDRIVVFCRDGSPMTDPELDLPNKRVVVTRPYAAFTSYESILKAPDGVFGVFDVNLAGRIELLAFQLEQPFDRTTFGIRPLSEE